MRDYYMNTEARDGEGYDDGTRSLKMTKDGLTGLVDYQDGMWTRKRGFRKMKGPRKASRARPTGTTGRRRTE